MGVKKLSKKKQPKQVNGFYKKPSLLSNFSMNLIRPGASVENQSQSFRTNTSIKKADNSNLWRSTHNNIKSPYNSFSGKYDFSRNFEKPIETETKKRDYVSPDLSSSPSRYINALLT